MRLQGQIRWKKSDYITLGKAVASFNKKINKLLSQETNISYLPERRNYAQLKKQIMTRNELKRVIQSLKSFSKAGEEELITLEGGEQLTKWEYNQIKSYRNTQIRRLNQELKELNTPKEGETYSRAQMGSTRVREIENELHAINRIEELSGFKFQERKWKILNRGSEDYVMRKAIIFRQNYLGVLERYSNLDNYNLLMDKLNSISNPIAFYEFVSQNELTGDLTYLSDQVYTQQAFNAYLIRLGFDVDDTITVTYDLKLKG